MIAHLKGTVGKMTPGQVVVDVNGVGYGIQVPMNDWDALIDGSTVHLHVLTYVREDRLDLYGFLDTGTKMLFDELIQLSGIGPRMGLELCDVPRALLGKAIYEHDAKLLTSIKGIGKKSAEKLLVELTSLAEREPHIFMDANKTSGHKFDQDTVAALSQLGFATPDILRTLDTLPSDLATTEERVAAALRVL